MKSDPSSLTENSYQYIKEQMRRNVLSPGTRLVNRKLAAEIGVSTIPVREAIFRLASEGFVDYTQGAGAFVRQVSRDDLDELFILRDLLESHIAGEAALYISASQLDDLQAIVDELVDISAVITQSKSGHATAAQYSRWLECDVEFHEILLHVSRKRLLGKVVQDNRAITAVLYAFRNEHKNLTPEISNATCKSKSELIQAFKDRNADGARCIMSEHIQSGRKTMLGFMREQERRKNTK